MVMVSRSVRFWFLIYLLISDVLPSNFGRSSWGLTPMKSLTRPVLVGYARRIKADPSFAWKSVTEVVLAAGTQFTAELSRRGSSRMMPEIDFVVAGVLTAVAGKYYSMWRVAPTLGTEDESDDITNKSGDLNGKDDQEPRLWSMLVPTNAFQATMSDGVTKPTMNQRLGSMIAPMPALFRAGILASAIGYGLTAIMISFRSLFLPEFTPATRNINILHACLYTGGFMAIFSNLRYQVLQGVIEPTIDKWFQKFPTVRACFIFSIRWANGFLGSFLAITGMRALGLQKLK